MIFNILKKAFIFNVIFCHYNPDHKIVIKTNVSDYVSEGIFFQYNEDKVLHSIIYFLKKHNSAECNYEIYDKEFMIIVYTFKEWHLKLEDFTFSVEIITDYKNLKYFMFIKQFSCCQIYWNEFLSHFNYCITYHFDKTENKLNVLTHQLDDLLKERDISDPHHLYQH